ncbi:MAG: SUMF1/EgtB/PvdO family nonheme iron enzyme [Planctomycetales bacterium]|nr:SUMF1/EgtB/PvdO family nonheme iron enzyme [Planctomycetales bacterium]
MGIFDNTSLAPENDPTTDISHATRAEIAARGLEIHGSLSRLNVDDGATACVLKATEKKSGRIVALKIYKHPDRKVVHRNGDSIPMTNFFENERRMLAGLQACPLVPKYYFSVAAGEATSDEPIQPFHVMEFVEGTRITKYVEESLAGDRAATVALFRQVLDAIETIHQFGYLHRDLSDGNILVDRQGNIRLIDLAEASPLGEQHTRLISTPGLGTEGVAAPEQQKIRRIQTDDVRDACTIGYAMFTGRWKQDGEGAPHWRHKLHNSGTPAGIASILVKGMAPRDPNREQDPRVWNTAREVIEAIDRVQRNQRFRKRLFRNILGMAAIAAVLTIFGYVAWDRVMQFAYTSEMRRLADQRQILSNSPQDARMDVRVQRRVNAANELEQQADASSSEGDVGTASMLLAKAVDEINEASRLADNIAKLKPLIQPLRKILMENEQWNRECEAVSRQLSALGSAYQVIQNEVEVGNPEQAWALISDLQPKLVQLIDDNQKSYEIADLMEQMTSQSVGLDQSLKSHTDYEQIKNDCSRAARYYRDGKWSEARTELLAAMTSMKSFFQQHETEEQRKARLASNAEIVNAQLATNESLQLQVKDLTEQIASAKEEYQEVLFQGAQYQQQRDTAQKQLEELQVDLSTAQSNLDKATRKLFAAESERDALSQWKQDTEPKLVDLQSRLQAGSAAWEQQAAELKRTQDLISKITKSPGADSESAERQLELAKAEQAIEHFEPESLEQAAERLISESKQYEALLATRKEHIELGKTDRHADVRGIDEQLQSQFRIVVTALRKRDEQGAQAWSAFDSQIAYQRKLRETTIEEGWAESSSKIREIDNAIATLINQQKPHENGQARFRAGKYDFADWESLKSDVKMWAAADALDSLFFAEDATGFGELKLGTKFTNSIGQEFVYLPPGTFDMGSPSTEDGRDSDETQHKVTLTRGFFVAITENTQAAWKAVMNTEPWKGEPFVREGDNYPAVYVSAEDSDQFCGRLNNVERKNGTLPEGWEYRLLTEAEWEYACRAGEPDRFHYGDNESQLGKYAWFDDNAWDIGEKYAHEVGRKLPNRWGLYDMAGNTWEWTADTFADYPSSAVTDPHVLGGSFRVVRGGSFYDVASDCRSANRNGDSLGSRNGYLGFRVACVQLSK